MSDHLEHQTDGLAALLIAGDHATAERAVDALRELAWRWRADAIRTPRNAGPGTRGTVLRRAVVRRKPRGHVAVIAIRRRRPSSEKQLAVLYRRGIRVALDITTAEASDLIAAARKGA